MRASVIISTYNSPKWLKKVLLGYSVQTVNDFEIIIADDGSTYETKDLLHQISDTTQLNLTHVWQEDKGFQKTRILNKAILASTTKYLIFTDGDCIPRKDFVETHLNRREEGFFLSGGYFKLPLSISNEISQDDILNANCFDLKWLKEKGLKSTIKNIKLSKVSKLSDLFNFITPTTPSWNGHNSSTWKSDIIDINGFNNDMKYGGEDREFGERLINKGLKSKQIRYSAICVHLHHSHSYVNQEAIDKNILIRKNTKKNKLVKTPYGISSL